MFDDRSADKPGLGLRKTQGRGPVTGRSLGRAALLALCLCAAAAWAQQAAAPAVAASAAASVRASTEYRLGTGDVIRVTVYQNPDLTVETRITESGLVSYPLLGQVRLGGMRVSEAERAIADGLRNGSFVRQPQVTIALLQVRGHQASVLGHVTRPGRYVLETAEVRLSELLAMAGGISATGADQVVVDGQRDGKPFRVEVDVPSLFARSNRAEDLLILNGDTLWVERQPLVYIYGEVQRAGALRLERGMTLIQTLAAGGGLTQRGTERGIRVHRRGADGRIQVLQPAMDDPLQEGDVVYVRESLF
jgi:polysaccharide export outer membrane protein